MMRFTGKQSYIPTISVNGKTPLEMACELARAEAMGKASRHLVQHTKYSIEVRVSIEELRFCNIVFYTVILCEIPEIPEIPEMRGK